MNFSKLYNHYIINYISNYFVKLFDVVILMSGHKINSKKDFLQAEAIKKVHHINRNIEKHKNNIHADLLDAYRNRFKLGFVPKLIILFFIISLCLSSILFMMMLNKGHSRQIASIITKVLS